jgi:hypothetical protein
VIKDHPIRVTDVAEGVAVDVEATTPDLVLAPSATIKHRKLTLKTPNFSVVLSTKMEKSDLGGKRAIAPNINVNWRSQLNGHATWRYFPSLVKSYAKTDYDTGA